jgi:polar amino acid transport system substrate-binding protein
MIPAHAAVGILFLSVSAFADSQKTITALIPSTVPPPLLLSLEPAPQGLIKDYVEALSDEMGVQVSFLVIPRKRLNEYISSGKADINCYSNPIWNDDPTLFFWSQTLFFVRDIIVGRSSPDKQLQVPKSLNEFNGQAIGTIQGYRYPKLDPYFKTKSMIRDDAVNEESNLNKLFHAHLPFIVIDQLYLKYYRKNHFPF